LWITKFKTMEEMSTTHPELNLKIEKRPTTTIEGYLEVLSSRILVLEEAIDYLRQEINNLK
jgi:hypothetical protein